MQFSVTLLMAQKLELERTSKEFLSFTNEISWPCKTLYLLLFYPKGGKGVINYRVPALSLEE